MTARETAAAFRKLADVFDRVAIEANAGKLTVNKAACRLSEESALGAAGVLCYIRDLFTNAETEQVSRSEVLVILETISRDPEIFPHGTGQLFWQMEDD